MAALEENSLKSLEDIVSESKMPVQNLLAIHQVDVEIINRISGKFYLLMALEESQGITKVIRIHPRGIFKYL